MCIIIWNVHQFIGHCLIPLDNFVFVQEDSDIELGTETDSTEGTSKVYRFFQDMKLKGATVIKQTMEENS